jgi:lysozyme family protein
MMDPDFLLVMPLIFQDEGGFSNDPNDAGNWTGGAVGAGVVKGTNFGISAASYPDVDIANLTQEEATQIYYTDWWQHHNFGLLAAPFDMKCFDIAINIGAFNAIVLLQKACNSLGSALALDGVIGRNTAAAVGAAPSTSLSSTYVMFIINHYEQVAHQNPRDQKYLAGWLNRASQVMPNAAS